jgi:hypothetical protein
MGNSKRQNPETTKRKYSKEEEEKGTTTVLFICEAFNNDGITTVVEMARLQNL